MVGGGLWWRCCLGGEYPLCCADFELLLTDGMTDPMLGSDRASWMYHTIDGVVSLYKAMRMYYILYSEYIDKRTRSQLHQD
jgi:hypothetical protein